MLEINSCAIADASRFVFFDGLVLLLLLLVVSSFAGLLATEDAFFDGCLLLLLLVDSSASTSSVAWDDFTFFFFGEIDDDSSSFSTTSFVLAGACSSEVELDRDLLRDEGDDEERSFDFLDFDDDDFFRSLVALVSFSSSESESSNRPLGIMDGALECECDFDGDFECDDDDDDDLCFDLWVVDDDDLDGAFFSTSLASEVGLLDDDLAIVEEAADAEDLEVVGADSSSPPLSAMST